MFKDKSGLELSLELEKNIFGLIRLFGEINPQHTYCFLNPKLGLYLKLEPTDSDGVMFYYLETFNKKKNNLSPPLPEVMKGFYYT